MLAGKAEVIGRVPILRHDDVGEVGDQRVDLRHDIAAPGDLERAACAKIILNINDD